VKSGAIVVATLKRQLSDDEKAIGIAPLNVEIGEAALLALSP
jgi:hypothetical protein